MSFSRRVPSDLAPNRFSLALTRAREAVRPLLDLTCSNPTTVGLRYPPELLAMLALPASLVYEPQPFGLRSAREAVAADYVRRGVRVAADRIVLTASTSEAYSLLFKLLCNPGDRVLVPRPSYPLFDHLTALDAVESAPYLLEYHGRWSVDLDSVRQVITPRTRAILAVSPNNPTGSYLDARDLAGLAEVCEQHELALIGDEVFAEYAIPPMPVGPGSSDGVPSAAPALGWRDGVPSAAPALGWRDGVPSTAPALGWRDPGHPVFSDPGHPSVLSVASALTFGLGGLSKSVGLPQLKLGWIGVSGPDRLVEAALARLEVVCDSYLSVGTPVQHAAGALIAEGAAVRVQIAARISGNHRQMLAAIARYPLCAALRVEGGWYAVIQVPATGSEEDLVVALLDQDDVIVHPGYFFDFVREAFLVVSLLPRPEVFASAIERVLARASGGRR